MTRYRPASEVIWREVGGEVIVCSIPDGLYFVLNATAACVWQNCRLDGRNLRQSLHWVSASRLTQSVPARTSTL
jgi:hypothetical protein